MRDDVLLAHRLAGLATAIALSYADSAPRAWAKPDGSMVTEADLEVDAAIHGVLRAERPHDAALSEESPRSVGQSAREWVIDPIDGTADFLAREPSWGTHIALTIDDKVHLAIITRPALGICWWAVRGQGAFVGPIGEAAQLKPLHVSEVDDLARARVSGMVELGSPEAALLAECAQWTGDPVSVIGALAEGRLDAVLDDAGAAWDQAPATLLVTEAGGRFRDPLGGQRFDLGWGLYSNASLYSKLVELLPSPRSR